MCRVYFHQAAMGKSNQKIGKTVLENVTPLVTRELVAIRKTKNSKSKTTTLRCFDNLKKRQQDQGGKNLCYTERFVIDNIKSHNYCTVLKMLSF